MEFQNLKIIPNIKRRLEELEFNELFPIQNQAITPLLLGRDVIGQAKTGTGKTAAYIIPILEKLQKNSGVQALIIVPTRELAQQARNQFHNIAKYTSFDFLALYGGEPIDRQIKQIPKADVIIGTPGRLLDHLTRGTLNLRKLRTLVLDEADRMLDMGFIDDVRSIISHLPRVKQTCMFSATMPDEIIELAETTMRDPIKVLVDKDEISVEDIEQLYCLIEWRRKYQTLIELFQQFKWKKCIIFVTTRRQADWLTRKISRVIHTEKLHGGLPQNRRESVMEKFKNNERSVIIATDLAARGIDIAGIDCIINYDLPEDPLVYFHRIGRTGRAGEKGMAVSIVSYEEGPILRSIKSITKIKLKELIKHPQNSKIEKWIPKSAEQVQLVEQVF